VKSLLTILVASLISLPVFAIDPIRPNSTLTPGAVFSGVTVEQICKPGYANGSDVLKKSLKVSLKLIGPGRVAKL
jgi:hypothetical protein